jgi:hypothetical protein
MSISDALSQQGSYSPGTMVLGKISLTRPIDSRIVLPSTGEMRLL